MDWYQELLQTPAPPAEPRADRPDVTASDVTPSPTARRFGGRWIPFCESSAGR
jgi:hypothetical protein